MTFLSSIYLKLNSFNNPYPFYKLTKLIKKLIPITFFSKFKTYIAPAHIIDLKFCKYVKYEGTYYFISFILSTATSKYFLSISIPMNFLLFFIQATAVAPVPINKSKITSSSLDEFLISISINDVGFSVG